VRGLFAAVSRQPTTRRPERRSCRPAHSLRSRTPPSG
jgi:hypothetical protein